MREYKNWIDIPGIKNGGRYFCTAKDYKAVIIEGRMVTGVNRRKARKYVTREMSDREKESMIPFFEKHLCYKKNSYCTISDLYPTYKKMCEELGLAPLANSTFGSCIRGHVILMEEIPGVLISSPSIGHATNGYYHLGLK